MRHEEGDAFLTNEDHGSAVTVKEETGVKLEEGQDIKPSVVASETGMVSAFSALTWKTIC